MCCTTLMVFNITFNVSCLFVILKTTYGWAFVSSLTRYYWDCQQPILKESWMDTDIHKCYDTLVDSCSLASLNDRYLCRRSSDMLLGFIVKTDHFMVSLLWCNLAPFRVVEISIRRYAKETENMMPISSTGKRSLLEVWAEFLMVLRFSIS